MSEGQTYYSQLKPAWHQEQIDTLREGKIPRPVHIHMILSDLCNQDCHFCAYRMNTGLSSELFVGDSEVAKIGTNNPKRQMPTDKAIEIIKDCAEMGVKAIQFTGGGEPTVHSQHLEIIHHAQFLGMDTALVTNGLKLDPTSPVIQALKWIRVSIDAGDAESYARVRRVPKGQFHMVWYNVGALADTLYAGTLGIGFVVTPENYLGLVEAAMRAEDAGADNMRVGAVFSKEGLAYYGDLVPRIQEQIALAKDKMEKIDNNFKVIDLFGRRLGDLEGGSPDDRECYYQHFTVFIGGDLNVYRCCNTAYTMAGKVGNLREQRFLDFMRGAERSYYPFDARRCQYCQFTGHNKVIRSLITPPAHVNFV